MAHDVFISYSTEDKPAADAVCAILESNGVRCWVAPRDILPGADWGESIVDGIRASRVMLLVFSNNANKSKQIKREVELAADGGVTIVPLRIENTLPTESFKYFLGNIHWLDALSPPLEKHLQEVATKIKAILGPDSVGSPGASQSAVRAMDPENRAAPPQRQEMSGPQRPLFLRAPVVVALLVLLSLVALVLVANRHRIGTLVRPGPAIDLGGIWSCNDGGTYTIQQQGWKISWTGGNPPHFENSFEGHITDQGDIEGNWHDLPGYTVYNAGTLRMKIDSPSRLVRISQTGNFGGTVWTKR
jgi:hypothetical protein